MRAFLPLVPVLLSALLAGCAAAPPYSAPLPPPLQEEDYATVRAEGSTALGLLAASSSNIYIKEINDASVNSCRRPLFIDASACLPQLARLAPGRHAFTLMWRQMNLFHYARLEIALERGGQYVVRHEDDGKVGRFWVERDEVVLGAPVAVWSGTARPPANVTPKPPAEVPRSVQAFEEICLKQAPRFAGAPAAAQRFGITDFKDVGFMQYGLLPDSSLSVQIMSGSSCTVTTPTAATDPGAAFGALVRAYRDPNSGNDWDERVRIDGVTYHISHSRKHGEAFVMRRN